MSHINDTEGLFVFRALWFARGFESPLPSFDQHTAVATAKADDRSLRARIAFATPWKWAFDVVVAAMCVIAVPLALAPVRSWGQRVPIRLVYSLLWIGSSLLLLRSIASLIQAGYLLIDGRFAGFGIWEPWFYLGAILFTLSTLQSRRAGTG